MTHRLHEVMEVSSDITVLRDGVLVAEVATAAASPDDLVRHMAGREVAAFTRREVLARHEEVALRASGLRACRVGPV